VMDILINLLEVKPGKQDAMIALPVQRAEKWSCCTNHASC
jgi:hypothetical protein